MKPQRRLGAENAQNRTLLIDSAEQILCDEGYAAVTARRVAAKAGLKLPLVYYYFETMDDLILAVVKKNSERRLQRFVHALASADPLRALWDVSRNTASAISTTELLALANHRESIRGDVVAAGRQFRNLQTEAMGRLLAERGVDTDKYPPAAIVTIVSALTRAMAQDCALGFSEGYEEAVQLIERTIAGLNGDDKTHATAPAGPFPGQPHEPQSD